VPKAYGDLLEKKKSLIVNREWQVKTVERQFKVGGEQVVITSQL